MSDERTEHGQLREGDLLAYLEGAAAPAVARHIAGCAQCQEELAGLRISDRVLAAALERATCPAPEALLLFQNGLLAADAAHTISGHVAGCADCTAELALVAAPPEPGPIAQLAAATGQLLRAILQPAAAPALALRGSGPRRLVYAAGDYQLLLAVIPPPLPGGVAQIEGQLIGAEEALAVAPGVALLTQAGAEQQREPLDDLGFFAFDGLAPGSYAIDLAIGVDQINIDPIEVG